MKNPVDADKLIDELIEKKYSEDKFSLNDLMKLVEGQLDELYKIGSEEPYSGKYQKGPPDFEENVEQGKQIAYAAGMHGDPRNPRNDSDEFNPSAGLAGQAATGRISMIPEDTDGKNKSVNIEVPDILSMIISTKSSQVKSSDRQIIDDLFKRVGTNWKNRVSNLNKFFSQSSKDKPKNFRQAISSLIVLKAIRQITTEVEEPGKMFEYLLAPLLGTSCSVVGSEQGIIDVSCSTDGYSLKYLYGKDPKVKGSWENLKNFKGATYLICRKKPESNILNFYELTLEASSGEEISVVKGAIRIPKAADGQFYLSMSWIEKTYEPTAILQIPDSENTNLIMQSLATDLQNSITKVLNNFKDLNLNLIKYFTMTEETAGSKQGRSVGSECINNASAIQDGIVNLQK